MIVQLQQVLARLWRLLLSPRSRILLVLILLLLCQIYICFLSFRSGVFTETKSTAEQVKNTYTGTVKVEKEADSSHQTVAGEKKCKDMCHHNGICNDGVCRCSRFFHGVNCKNMISMDDYFGIKIANNSESSNMTLGCLDSSADKLCAGLEKYHSLNRVVTSITNLGFVEGAIQWAMRLERLGITNYFVVALDDASFNLLRIRSINVVHIDEVIGGVRVSQESQKYGSEKYFEILENKPKITLEILRRGFHVLMSDADTTWLSNPMNDMDASCSLSISTDSRSLKHFIDLAKKSQERCLQTGIYDLSPSLYFAKSTLANVYFFQVLSDLLVSSDLHDQPLFNHLIFQFRHREFSVKVMDLLLYPSGLRYFVEKVPQSQNITPVVLHNNWIARGKNMMFDMICALANFC